MVGSRMASAMMKGITLASRGPQVRPSDRKVELLLAAAPSRTVGSTSIQSTIT